MQSNTMRWKNLSQSKKVDSSLQISTWTQLSLLSKPGNLSNWNFWCNKWKWNDWYWTNEEDCSTHHVWNYLRSKCLRNDVWRQCNGFELLDPNYSCQKTNPETTLWVRETCLILGLGPLIIVLITVFLSFKTYNMALEPQCFVYLMECDQCLLEWRWCAWLGWSCACLV